MTLETIANKLAASAAALIALLLALAAPARAQSESPFTVLATSSDLHNRKLYAEIMFERQRCSEHQARFWLEDRSGLRLAAKVDSVLNNAGSYTLSRDSIYLIRPKAGGYRLRFALPKGAKAADSLRLCVESYELAYRCRGCGVGGSDLIFEPANINKECPYKGKDMLACHLRKGKAANWEGWIRDERDCKPYRIVLMPDAKWWMAQNLAYTEKMVNSGNANVGLNNAAPPDNNTLWGNYWCTGIPPRGKGSVTATSGMAACDVYGALYTWNTAMRRNGRAEAHDKAQARDMFSAVQGICPDGWIMPSDFDWGVMLNVAEGCDNTDLFEANGAAPCNHLLSGTAQRLDLGAEAFARLKAALSCPPHLNTRDSICPETAAGAWIWRRKDVQGKLITPHNLGQDYFGFSALPAGLRYGSGKNSYFEGAGTESVFWTSSEYNGDNGFLRYLDAKSDLSGAGSIAAGKFNGMSVRCIKSSTGDRNPRILRLPDVSGVNTGEATFTAYTTLGATVDWYDAPVNGKLLLSGSHTFSVKAPMKVYAQARNANGSVVAPTFVSARASFTYRYSGSYYRVPLGAGEYSIACYGAAGQSVGRVNGGRGGMAEGLYETSVKVVAYVYAGGMGRTFNGAGAGGAAGPSSRGGGLAGGTGGGASDVRINGTGLQHRIIVAGGGGGSGGRGSDFPTAGVGGDQNTAGKNATGASNSSSTVTVWSQGGGGGGGGGYRNGGGGSGGEKQGRGGCRPGIGGAVGAAGSNPGTGSRGGAASYFGCAGGGGAGGTHYVGGVAGGTFKNTVNSGDGYVIITPK
jgi:uncharacterized protein (TIGR02145 family)